MGGSTLPGTQALYDQIAPIVLGLLSARVECPIPPVSPSQEPVYCSGALPRIVPRYWPITAVSAVVLADGTPLPVGTPFQLAQATNGTAVAIDPSGMYLRTGCRWKGDVFVSYTAGFTALPVDLLEVFFEWCLLVGKEKDRAGVADESIDQVKVSSFVRKLPDWALRTIHHYDRMTAYR